MDFHAKARANLCFLENSMKFLSKSVYGELHDHTFTMAQVQPTLGKYVMS